jgi:hypothetical protein
MAPRTTEPINPSTRSGIRFSWSTLCTAPHPRGPSRACCLEGSPTFDRPWKAQTPSRCSQPAWCRGRQSASSSSSGPSSYSQATHGSGGGQGQEQRLRPESSRGKRVSSSWYRPCSLKNRPGFRGNPPPLLPGGLCIWYAACPQQRYLIYEGVIQAASEKWQPCQVVPGSICSCALGVSHRYHAITDILQSPPLPYRYHGSDSPAMPVATCIATRVTQSSLATLDGARRNRGVEANAFY